ncbi:MAG TPA: DSD1 family PLP-dependent enzyme [Aliidongia sp.]|nr:DSD1 family PLP-dependent enzyme [Aliidongia sp.]
MTDLDQLDTPSLLLDEDRMARNADRLNQRMAALGVTLRPHLKTAKSVEVARRILGDPARPATVSTLKEAEIFAAAGMCDLLYTMGMAPSKLDRAVALRRRGADLKLVVDSVEAAEAVAAHARVEDDPIPVLIEIDSDDHRAGVKPEAAERLVAIGRALEAGAALGGVMTHAGASYDARGEAALVAMAEQERAAAVTAAGVLRAAGLPCPIVSVGSTPTAHFAKSLDGVTEVRAGVYMFFDLVMAGIGVCSLDDIALSVLATVIGHQRDKGWILVDAGWMAMSRDRGTAKQPVDQGYGVACDLDLKPYADLIMVDANQEHGLLAIRPGGTAALPDLPLGARVRILPNHACATGAQHDCYEVVGSGARQVRATWPRFNGW